MASNFGFPAYGGTEKKVFISYKKVDEARVAAIARELHNLGINVWYDEAGGEGLKLGRKWEETISENMELSSAVVAFISRAFFNTQGYMRTEFNMANSHELKRLYVVFLDDVSYDDIDIADLSLWSQINAYQCIKASGMSAQEVARQLIDPVQQLFRNDNRDLARIRKTIENQRSSRDASRTKRDYTVVQGDEFDSGYPVKGNWLTQNKTTLAILAVFAVLVIAVVAAVVNSSPQKQPFVPGQSQVETEPDYSYQEDESDYQQSNETFDPAPQYEVGDIITMGKYNQDGIMSNGKEDIQWIVIDVDSDKAMIVSLYAFDLRQFHNNRKNADTWDTCDLRDWLNGEFYDSAFTSSEKSRIQLTTIENNSNSLYGTYSGSSTRDRIFLLSADEASMYLSESQRRADNLKTGDSCWWWLRTAGDEAKKAVYVNEFGYIGMSGNYINDKLCVRPAAYISVS